MNYIYDIYLNFNNNTYNLFLAIIIFDFFLKVSFLLFIKEQQIYNNAATVIA